MEHAVRRVVWAMGFAGLLFGSAPPAFAQDTPRVELSGGYSLQRLRGNEVPDEIQTMGKGWYVDVAGNVTNVFSIVGLVGGN